MATVRRGEALLAVLLLGTLATYTRAAWLEMTWRGPVETVHGTLAPPRLDGPWWTLRPAEEPVTEPAAARARVLAEAAARGLEPTGEVRAGRRGRPPVPSLVQLTGGRPALLLERAAHVARLYDPARGEVVLLSRQLGGWLEGPVEPLRERTDPGR